MKNNYEKMKDHLYNGEVAYKIGYGNDYNNYLLNKYKLSSTHLYNNMLDSTSLPCGLISCLEHQIDTVKQNKTKRRYNKKISGIKSKWLNRDSNLLDSILNNKGDPYVQFYINKTIV